MESKRPAGAPAEAYFLRLRPIRSPRDCRHLRNLARGWPEGNLSRPCGRAETAAREDRRLHFGRALPEPHRSGKAALALVLSQRGRDPAVARALRAPARTSEGPR